MSVVCLHDLDTFQISLNNDIGTLEVCMESDKFLIRSIKEDDLENLYRLYSDPVVMKKFATGCITSRNECAIKINQWVKRFKQNNPFSGYVIYEKTHFIEPQFTGIAVLGKGIKPGYAQYAIVLKKEAWGKGYGSIITNLFLNIYAPELRTRGYKPYGYPFRAIEASARIDNFASNKVLQNAGMQIVGQGMMYGFMRNQYEKKL